MDGQQAEFRLCSQYQAIPPPVCRSDTFNVTCPSPTKRGRPTPIANASQNSDPRNHLNRDLAFSLHLQGIPNLVIAIVSRNTVTIHALIIIAVASLAQGITGTLPCNQPLSIILLRAQRPRIIMVPFTRTLLTIGTQIVPTTQISFSHLLQKTFLHTQNFVNALPRGSSKDRT
jgi:hypothetical protein